MNQMKAGLEVIYKSHLLYWTHCDSTKHLHPYHCSKCYHPGPTHSNCTKRVLCCSKGHMECSVLRFLQVDPVVWVVLLQSQCEGYLVHVEAGFKHARQPNSVG